jgi:alpha-mannosidase II
LLLATALASALGQDVTVWVCPHSHDDVGWVRTVDEYYDMQVQHVYSTVVDALAANPNRTWTFVEIAYMSRWWASNATERQKATVRTCVEQRRCTFSIGGYVMNDEACTTSYGIVHQLSLGHQWIKSTFGSRARPVISWQIDPFGLSSNYASILHQSGITEGHVIRIGLQPLFALN